MTTDSRGIANVGLPRYFHQINKNPKYQLTVMDDGDDFAMAKVSQEVHGNRFQIRTSKPHVRVSWEIKGGEMTVGSSKEVLPWRSREQTRREEHTSTPNSRNNPMSAAPIATCIGKLNLELNQLSINGSDLL